MDDIIEFAWAREVYFTSEPGRATAAAWRFVELMIAERLQRAQPAWLRPFV